MELLPVYSLCQVSLGKFLKVLDPFHELTNRSAGYTVQSDASLRYSMWLVLQLFEHLSYTDDKVIAKGLMWARAAIQCFKSPILLSCHNGNQMIRSLFSPISPLFLNAIAVIVVSAFTGSNTVANAQITQF